MKRIGRIESVSLLYLSSSHRTCIRTSKESRILPSLAFVTHEKSRFQSAKDLNLTLLSTTKFPKSMKNGKRVMYAIVCWDERREKTQDCHAGGSCASQYAIDDDDDRSICPGTGIYDRSRNEDLINPKV